MKRKTKINNNKKRNSDRIKHVTREISTKKPMHMVLKTNLRISLQGPRATACALEQIEKAKKKYVVNIFQFYLQGKHLHILAFTPDRLALQKAMQYIASRIAIFMNKMLGRKHVKFWADRYFSCVKRTASEIRRAIHYVANQEDYDVPFNLVHSSLFHIDDSFFGFPVRLLNMIGIGKSREKLENVILDKNYVPYELRGKKKRCEINNENLAFGF